MKITLSENEYEAIVNTALFQQFGTALGLGSIDELIVSLSTYKREDYCTISKIDADKKDEK